MAATMRYPGGVSPRTGRGRAPKGELPVVVVQSGVDAGRKSSVVSEVL